MSTEANITKAAGWFIGEDKQLVFDVKDAVGDPLDMTNHAVEWTLKRKLGAGTALITKTMPGPTFPYTFALTFASSITNGAGTNDRVTVQIADTETDPLQPGNYVHSLRRTDSGEEGVLSHGDVELRQGA